MMNTIPVNKKFPLKWLVLGILSIVLFAGTFVLVRNLVTSWCLSPLPGVALTGCGGNGSAPMFTEANNNTPEPGLPTPELPPPAPVIPNAELPPAWDGASRINVLLLGLDSYDARLTAPVRHARIR